MEREGEETHISKEEARAGRAPHILRYILIISLVLAIVVLSIIWMTGAATTADVHDSSEVEQAVAAAQEEDAE